MAADTAILTRLTNIRGSDHAVECQSYISGDNKY